VAPGRPGATVSTSAAASATRSERNFLSLRRVHGTAASHRFLLFFTSASPSPVISKVSAGESPFASDTNQRVVPCPTVAVALLYPSFGTL
jgi:hypothetical protein